jgi:hypothetical protein
MKDFEKIRKICEESSKISETLIDEFLLYYAAGQNKLEQDMNQKFASYKHMNSKLGQRTINMMKSQYIIHKVFKKEGLINKLLNHSALKALAQRERSYLEFQAANPWRFSYSVVKKNPAENFFIMKDVFSDEEYLLHSPGVKNYLESQSVILFFNLISFNGSCWQSFGPIGAFNSFEPDDIFFFATELDPDIADEQMILENLESNPLPYMMLISGANTPRIFNKKDQIVQVLAEYEVDSINTKKLTKTFTTEYNEGVYRLSLKTWGSNPHFSQAYFDENRKILVLSAMTDRGFVALVDELNEYGYNFSDDPFLRVNLSMVSTASDILKKKIRLSEYEDLFTKTTTPASKKNLEDHNLFIGLVLPEINAGIDPDINAAAKEAGIDLATAKILVKAMKGSIDKLKKDNRKK